MTSPSCSFAECLVNEGTISNSGNITLNSAVDSVGIDDSGTIVNMGNLTIENVAVTGQGIYNEGTGTIINTASGSVLLESTGDETTGIYNSGTITNSGDITAVSPSSSSFALGLLNAGTVTNYGMAVITGTGEFGMVMGDSGAVGTFNNYGTIANRGTTTDPFDNYYGVLNEECGDIVVGIASFQGTVDYYAWGRLSPACNRRCQA